MKKEIFCDGVAVPVCPNCGDRIFEPQEMADIDDGFCNECGCEYDFYREVSVSYTTRIKEKLK